MPHRSIRSILLIISLLLLLLVATTAYAGLGIGLTFTPDCSGYEVRGGSLTANRDNTGRGREAVVITARDGSGQIITETETTYPINQRVIFPDGALVNWEHVPQYNPIVMEVDSPSGNGQPDQAIYLVTGNCATLPTYGQGAFAFGDDLTLLPILPLGVVSASYDPNVAPPRPVNPPGLAQTQPGYAVVAADNLFVRSGDGAQYSPVGIVDGGTELVVLGQNGKSSGDLWWYVAVGGLRGWVKSSLLYLRGDLTNVPVAPVEGTLTQPTLYVGSNNPIYNTASAGGRYLCQIQGNLFYNVVGQDFSTAQWYHIQATCDGQPILGWIQAARGILRNSGGVEIPITS